MHDPFQNYAAGNPYQGTIPYPVLAMQGLTTPFGLPGLALQNQIAPLNPLAPALGLSSAIPGGGIQQPGLPYSAPWQQSGIVPQQAQLASLLANQTAIPQLLALLSQAGGAQNPLLTGGHHNNPQFSFGMANPFQNPGFGLSGQVSQLGWPQQSPYQQQQPYQFAGQPGLFFGQSGSPFGQISPSGQGAYPLAPQTWIGHGSPFAGAQPFGQFNPLLSQLGGRPFPIPGVSPSIY